MPSVQSIPDNVVVSYYLAAQADRHLSTPDGMTLKLLHQLYSAGNAMARSMRSTVPAIRHGNSHPPECPGTRSVGFIIMCSSDPVPLLTEFISI